MGVETLTETAEKKEVVVHSSKSVKLKNIKNKIQGKYTAIRESEEQTSKHLCKGSTFTQVLCISVSS